MTRVHNSHPHHAPRRDILNESRAEAKKEKPYKVVLEAVTQEKKKLHPTLSYTSDSPDGYGYISVGHSEFTEWCKEQCRQRNYDVHIVSTKPSNRMHTDPDRLSHHVHRMGHHFPLDIIALACKKFNCTYTKEGGLKEQRDVIQIVERFNGLSSELGGTFSKIEDRNKASKAVRELFPKIPENDLNSVMDHAFKEGSNRVGTVADLTLSRRVQLAVLAHIRHKYTEYDKLLKTHGWITARREVEAVSLAKIKEWRDETGAHSDELEETFREIIVLDDEDDEDDDQSGNKDPMSPPAGREPSLEIISTRATARDSQTGSYPFATTRAQQIPPRTMPAPRYHAPQRVPLPVEPRPQAPHHSSIGYGRPRVQISSHRDSNKHNMVSEDHSRSDDHQLSPAHMHQGLTHHRPRVERIGGRLYQLEPVRDDEDISFPPPGPLHRSAPQSPHSRYVLRSPVAGPLTRTPAHSRRPSEQDLVIPSVESEASVSASSQHPGIGNPPQLLANSSPRENHKIRSPKVRALPHLQQDAELRSISSPKRARPFDIEDERSLRSRLSYYPAAFQNDRVERAYATSGEYIDLTSSPQRARVHPGGLQYGQHADVSSDHRRPVPRELRGSYHEVPVVERSHSAIPIGAVGPRTRGYYLPVTQERVYPEESRNPRNGFDYGGHPLQ